MDKKHNQIFRGTFKDEPDPSDNNKMNLKNDLDSVNRQPKKNVDFANENDSSIEEKVVLRLNFDVLQNHSPCSILINMVEPLKSKGNNKIVPRSSWVNY